MYLQTDRLQLEWIRSADLEDLLELDSDPEVMRFLTGGMPHDRQTIASEILPKYLSWQSESSGYGYFVARLKSTDAFLGWFHLRPKDKEHWLEPELGYRLLRRYWGCGYATEGAQALIAKAFLFLGSECVWASTMAVNQASQRVMVKAGLHYVRTDFSPWAKPISGSDQGVVFYTIDRRQWLANRLLVGDH